MNGATLLFACLTVLAGSAQAGPLPLSWLSEQGTEQRRGQGTFLKGQSRQLKAYQQEQDLQLVRKARHLCHDQKPSDMLHWWHSNIGFTVEHTIGVREFEARFRNVSGTLNKASIEDNEKFLEMVYFLRSITPVKPSQHWDPAKSKCHANCTQYGTCNEELGRCDCPRGRKGPACSEVWPEKTCEKLCMNYYCMHVTTAMCPNHCNNRGTCISQFCHCYPGFFGADCSLSLDSQGKPQLLEGRNYKPHPRGPKIYVYEVPPQYNVWALYWVDRPIGPMLWERFLSGGFRTADPDEADYYFFPVLGRGCVTWDEPLDYVLEHWGRYVARDGGRRTIVIHLGDWGISEPKWHPSKDPMVRNFTSLTHWGFQDNRSPLYGDWFRQAYWPDKDIIIPTFQGDQYKMFERSPFAPEGALQVLPRKNLGMMAGGICGWRDRKGPPCQSGSGAYSFGMRERLYKNLHGKPDFLVETSVPDQGLEMLQSRFCFAPTGAGHGKRQVMVAVMGCTPVLIADNVYDPFHPFLDWSSFAVRIAEADVDKAESILRAIPPEQEKALKDRLPCAVRHMLWTTMLGGVLFGDDGRFDAMNTLLAILRTRVKHPGVPDHKLTEVDPDFADFMACKETPANAPLRRTPASSCICSTPTHQKAHLP